MTKLNVLFRKGLMAIALAGAAFGASAAPTTYHVNLDTTSLAGGTYLEFGFSGSQPTPSATATVSNLTGNGLTFDSTDGGVVDADGKGFVLTNSIYSYVDYIGAIAGMFSFDLTFSDGYLADTGFQSLFSVSVLGSDFDPVQNGMGFAQFTLSPVSGISTSIAPVFGDATLAPSDVPEPSELLLMLSGLALMGMMMKRRAQQ